MSKMGWFRVAGVIRGHWKEHHLIEHIRGPMSISLSCTISDIARYRTKVADLNLPHLYLAPVGGDPVRILLRFLASENQESLGYHMALFV